MTDKNGLALGSNTGRALDRIMENVDHSSMLADVINRDQSFGERFWGGYEAANYAEYGASAWTDGAMVPNSALQARACLPVRPP